LALDENNEKLEHEVARGPTSSEGRPTGASSS